MGLEDTSWASGFRLTIFKPHRIGAGYVGGRGSHDLGHDGRTGLVLVDGSLDQLLLVLGAASFSFSLLAPQVLKYKTPES